MFRTTLIPGDPLRNFTVLSSVVGGLNAPLRLESADGSVNLPDAPLGASPDPEHLRMVVVPADTPPGVYTLTCGAISRGTLTVLAPPPPPEPLRAPDLRAFLVVLETLRHRPPGGPVEVTFGPGVHRYSGAPIDLSPLPAGSTLRGNGCRVVNEGTAGYRNALFVNPLDNLTVEDFAFHGEGLTFHSPVLRKGLVVHCCDFADCLCPAWGYREALFRKVEMDRACLNGCPLGLYWEGRSRGTRLGDVQHAFSIDQATDSGYGVLDWEFADCDRGVCVFTNGGPITGCFFVYRVSGLDRAENGNELFSAEGQYGFDRNLVSVTGSNNYGRLQLWNAPARGNLIRARLAGPGGILLAGDGGVIQTGNVIDGFELQGGNIAFGPTATGNVVRNGTIGPVVKSFVNQPLNDPGGLVQQPPILPTPGVVKLDGIPTRMAGGNVVEPTVDVAQVAADAVRAAES